LFCLCLTTPFQAKSVKNAGQWPIHWNALTLTAPDPLVNTFQVNLRDTANYTLTHSSDVPIQVCFQETYNVPANPSSWKQSCTIHASFATSGERTVAFRQSVYSVGIYFDGTVAPGKQTTLSLDIGKNSAETCPDDKVWDSTSCQTPIALTKGKNSFNFTADVPQVFSFVVPLDPTLTGSVSLGGASLALNFRRVGAPSNLHSDASGSGLAKLVHPRPGTYLALVTSTVTQNTDITFTLEDCTHSKLHGSGAGCKLYYNHDDDDEDIIGIVGQYYFWQMVITPDEPLHVSIANNVNDGKPYPRLLASRGNIPTVGNADFTGCNTVECGYANIIHYSPKSNETWYIAAIPVDGFNNTDYGIWFKEECAPSCEHNGECTEEGPNTGLCKCTDPANKGVGCQRSSSLSKQYVVLAAIWGTAIGVTVLVLLAQFFTSNKETYERLA